MATKVFRFQNKKRTKDTFNGRSQSLLTLSTYIVSDAENRRITLLDPILEPKYEMLVFKSSLNQTVRAKQTAQLID